jgi:hypothetical protein
MSLSCSSFFSYIDKQVCMPDVVAATVSLHGGSERYIDIDVG